MAVVNVSLGRLGWAATCAAVFLFGLVLVYAFQDEPPQPIENEYYALIGQITGIGKTLSSLSVFLEKERQRVVDTQGVVKKLEEEKAELEPILKSQRETVEAILAVHARRSASHAWKERIIGFALGVLGSMLATVVYDYFKH
jgi:hypothetical protein